MSINDISEMLVNTCPRLRTLELNNLTALIADYTEGEESADNVEGYVDACVLQGHMSEAERKALLGKVWEAIK